MIKRLVIHRFRGIRDGVLDDLGKINLLIGPNNSGKTAILELLYLGGTSGRLAHLILDDVPAGEGESIAFQAATSVRSDFLGLEPLPRLRKRHGYREKWTDAPVTLTDEGGLEINLAALEHEMPLRTFRLGSPLPEWGLRDKARFYKKDIGVVALFSLDRREGIPKSLIPARFSEREVESETSRWHYLWEPIWAYRWNRQEPVDRLAIWAEEGQVPASDKVLFFDFHVANTHFTSRFAQWAKDQPWDWVAKIGEHLRRVFPELAGVKIEIDDAPGRRREEAGYVRGDEGRIIVDQLGDGTRHAFKVLAGLIALCETVDEEHPGLFLWEDPELFMHPESLSALLGEIILLTRDKPVQIFLSSQSMEVIALLTSHIQTSEPPMQSGYRVFRLDLEDGRLYVAKYHYRNILAWLKEGMDARFWGATKLPISYRYSSQSESATEDV